MDGPHKVHLGNFSTLPALSWQWQMITVTHLWNALWNGTPYFCMFETTMKHFNSLSCWRSCLAKKTNTFSCASKAWCKHIKTKMKGHPAICCLWGIMGNVLSGLFCPDGTPSRWNVHPASALSPHLAKCEHIICIPCLMEALKKPASQSTV